jgi:orotate phosphoribosyltransferase
VLNRSLQNHTMIQTKEYWIRKYQEKGALWIHDKNPNRPHALLASGFHSNGFFNSRLVIPDETLLYEAGNNLFELFIGAGGNYEIIGCVAGPQTGATKLAEFLSEIISAQKGRPCLHASPAKGELKGRPAMIFSEEEEHRVKGRAVLLCEDVLTTGGSVSRAERAIIRAGGYILPYILVLVNRSGSTAVDGKKIIALIDHSMPLWEKDNCPLCKQGSEALPPKGENWQKLNAIYQTTT